TPPPARATCSPYTTLFRSCGAFHEYAADDDLLDRSPRHHPRDQRARHDHGRLRYGHRRRGGGLDGETGAAPAARHASGRRRSSGACPMSSMRSKLPHAVTTIFTVMTNRARELGAINLAQGFPDFDAPGKLKDLVAYHVAAGHNQCAPMIGVAKLREQIAAKLGASYGRAPDAEK